MKLQQWLMLIFIMFPQVVEALPAFPGAEGMGAATVGGRGGAVYIVDTLSDNPADGLTFREAVTASGKRYVTFAVSGIIDLISVLDINQPYLTIAGETSPGGILIAGWQTQVSTHDVLVRHMRFRLGAHRANDIVNAETNDAIAIIGSQTSTVTAYNIVFDHCSMSWGLDETVSVNYNAQDVVFSWCFITSGLMNSAHPDGLNHSAGFIAWGKYADPEITVSLHHTFMGYHYFRLPENNYDSFIDSVNNVTYYFNTTYSHEVGSIAGYHSKANIIGTYRKINPSVSTEYTRSAFVLDYANNIQESIYISGVVDGTRKKQTDLQWSAQEYWQDTALATAWKRSTPWATTGYSGQGIAVTSTVMDSTYASLVVANAGATKPLRDSVDTVAAADYEAGVGSFTNAANVDNISKFPTFTAPAAPVDSDSDGMSDSWENAEFGDLNSTAIGDDNLDGYDNIENYFHYLTGVAVSSAQHKSGGTGSGTGSFH